MELHYRKRNDTLYVSIAGIIDRPELGELERYFNALTTENCQAVILNLSGVHAVTTSLIGKLLKFYAALTVMGKHLGIRGVNPGLYETFRFIRLNTFFPIER